MIRTLMILCAAGGLAACAHQLDSVKADPTPLTPTENFALKVSQAPDEILLAPHKTGLSARQAQALSNFVDRWREAGGGEISLQRSPAADVVLDQSAEAVAKQLLVLGVEPDDIRLLRYTAGERPANAMVVSFVRSHADVPKCGRDWKSFTSSAANKPNSNFGCAVTANFAAMIDDPNDLATPRPVDPVDAARRETIIDNYRKGVTTSSAKDEQASGAVSAAVQ